MQIAHRLSSSGSENAEWISVLCVSADFVVWKTGKDFLKKSSINSPLK